LYCIVGLYRITSLTSIFINATVLNLELRSKTYYVKYHGPHGTNDEMLLNMFILTDLNAYHYHFCNDPSRKVNSIKVDCHLEWKIRPIVTICKQF